MMWRGKLKTSQIIPGFQWTKTTSVVYQGVATVHFCWQNVYLVGIAVEFCSPFLTKEETTTAEWKDKGRSNSFLSKVQIGYESFIWVQLLTRVPTSHLNETTQYKYSMQELFSFRYIFFLSTFFYNFVHTV